MSGAEFVGYAAMAALAILTLALLLALVRLVRGPTLPDRVLALDTMTTLALGYIAVVAVHTGIMLYIDVAISIGLVGFLATVAFARYVFHSKAPGRQTEQGGTSP